MQKFIAKFGTAAHLAIVAVAPLFLFPFADDKTISIVLLWLTIPAVSWVVSEPSVRHGEMLHEARRRVIRNVFRDPLFWTLLTVIVIVGVRALNGGISMRYNAEESSWSLSQAQLPLLPGCVEDAGLLPFSASVALFVLVQGCRHALGRSARMAFCLMASILAGMAAVMSVVMVGLGNEGLTSAVQCSDLNASFVGMAFALHLLWGTVSLFSAFENKWRLVMPLYAFAIGGTAAGAFAFLPPLSLAIVLVAETLVLAYVFACSVKALPSAGEFKLLVVTGIAFVLGGLLVVAALPENVVLSRIEPFMSFEFLLPDFLERRATLTAVAVKSWLANLWIGTGVGSFPLDFRFHAAEADWLKVRGTVLALPNGWGMLAAERGIVGALLLLVPTGFLLFTYGRRLLKWIPTRTVPHPACLLLPVMVAVLAVSGAYDCSFLRVDVLMPAGAVAAISAASFAKNRGSDHG